MMSNFAFFLWIAAAAAPDSGIVIRNARVFDVGSGAIERTTLVIENGRIVGRGANPRHHPAAIVIPGDSLTVLPGLIDMHVHFGIGGRPRENAARTLAAGFTTVADLGSAGGTGSRLHRLIDADSISGPHLIAAGSWIGGRGGVCEFGGATIRGVAEARARAAADVAAGARMLKICVSNWLETAELYPDSVEMSDDEIAAVMAEAKRANIPVAAHALSERAVLVSIRAGVTLLAHTPIVSDATAAEVARRKVCVSTTLTSLEAADKNGQLRASVARLRQAGARLVVGTDAGVVPHGDNAAELVTLTKYGFTALQAIQAGTSTAAECLGIARYGKMVPGATADLVLVKGDPLADITILRKPAGVIKAGRIIL